jgi:hypothetical protein
MRGGRPLSARLLRVLVPVIVVVQLTATADVPVRPAVAAVIRTAPVTAYAAPPQPAYHAPAPAFGFESVALHVTDTGADTVIGNLTVTGPTGTGYTTVYPCLEGRPHASNNNFLAGQTIPNLVVAHTRTATETSACTPPRPRI